METLIFNIDIIQRLQATRIYNDTVPEALEGQQQ